MQPSFALRSARRRATMQYPVQRQVAESKDSHGIVCWRNLAIGEMLHNMDKRKHRRWVLTVTILGSSMAMMDGTVVSIALPPLQTTMGATIADVQWVVEAYTLFLAALMLTGGALGDRLGRKRIFLIGIAKPTVINAPRAEPACPRQRPKVASCATDIRGS